MQRETEKTLELLKLGMNPLTDAFKDIMDAAKKTVHVSLDNNTLSLLKDNGYKLCFAKKVGDSDYNVVWQSYEKYENNNTFSWVPSYQIYATNSFEDAIEVEVRSNPVEIGLGEEVIRDKNGVFSDAVSGGVQTALNLINNGNSTHIGISQLSTGLDGKMISTAIYVSENKIISGEANFQPVERVLVWFEQEIQTSTMFSKARSKSKELDLTSRNDVKVTFDGKQWEYI